MMHKFVKITFVVLATCLCASCRLHYKASLNYPVSFPYLPSLTLTLAILLSSHKHRQAYLEQSRAPYFKKTKIKVLAKEKYKLKAIAVMQQMQKSLCSIYH